MRGWARQWPCGSASSPAWLWPSLTPKLSTPDLASLYARLSDVPPQLWIGRKFGQQQSVGHQHQARGVGHLIGESDSKTDAATQRLADFLGNPRGQGAGRQPPRLSMRDAALHAPPQFEAILGQLGALAGAGLAGDDQYLAAAQRLQYGFAPR